VEWSLILFVGVFEQGDVGFYGVALGELVFGPAEYVLAHMQMILCRHGGQLIECGAESIGILKGEVPADAEVLEVAPGSGVGNQDRQASTEGFGNHMAVVFTFGGHKENI